MPCQCDDCKHACVSSYWVGDSGYGDRIEDWSCDMDGDPRMAGAETVDGLTPEERGCCPCYEPLSVVDTIACPRCGGSATFVHEPGNPMGQLHCETCESMQEEEDE